KTARQYACARLRAWTETERRCELCRESERMLEREPQSVRDITNDDPRIRFRRRARCAERPWRHVVLRRAPIALAEIQDVRDVVGGGIAHGQRLESPAPLDESQHRRVVEEIVRH